MLSAALLLGACAAPTETSKPVDHRSSIPGTVFDLAMAPDNAERGSDPVVVASIEGVATKLVVDTGSSHLIVTAAFLKRIGLADLAPGAHRRPLRVRLGDFEFTVDRFFSIGDAPHFDSKGWDGLISPQRIDPSAYVVADFANQRLLAVPGHQRSDVWAYLRSRYPERTVHTLPWLGRDFGTILTKGRLGSREEVLIDIDSGNFITSFVPGYVGAGLPTRDGPRAVDVAGEVSTMQIADDQMLGIGTLQMPGMSVGVREKAGRLPNGLEWKGSVGMDVLGRAAMVIPPEPAESIHIVVSQAKR
jgi:hypothetical protein